ncbi:MAG: hypothetical protein ACK4UX_08820, partial [Thiobacillus sp.]
MTDVQNRAKQPPDAGQASLSGLPDAPELLRIRILPAQFARVLGVSKQSVSRWVKDGWVTLGADGRLDPTVAVNQLLRRCDPGRMRARWLRQAVGDIQDLRTALAAAEARADAAVAELAETRANLAACDRWNDSAELAAELFRDAIVEANAELRAAETSDWPQILTRLQLDADELADAKLHPESLLDDPVCPELDAEIGDIIARASTYGEG